MILTIRTAGPLGSGPGGKRRPSQFHIDSSTGRCVRGRAAKLWQLVGFVSNPDVFVMEEIHKEFVANPQAVIGKFPVMLDLASGTMFTLLEKVKGAWPQAATASAPRVSAADDLTALADAVGVLREAGPADG